MLNVQSVPRDAALDNFASNYHARVVMHVNEAILWKVQDANTLLLISQNRYRARDLMRKNVC